MEEPTGADPQSRLWFHDGSWWGVLFEQGSGEWRIQQLDGPTQVWRDTGTLVDERAASSSDVLWDGSRLYVVSGGRRSSSEDAVRLLRFSYDAEAGRHNLDAGFPVVVKDRGAHGLTIAKDSTGQLWIAYVDAATLFVNRSLGTDTDWGTPFTPAVPGTSGATDQAAVIAYGSRVRVVWTNDGDAAFYCADHADADADAEWSATSIAVPSPRSSDDHIHLSALESDEHGRLFVAVKTSTREGSDLVRTAPLLLLLVVDDAGRWESHVFGQVGDDHTSPLVLLDEEQQMIHMFATAPTGGGAIYHKRSPIDDISFGSGRGTPFVTSLDDPQINNATSTKQVVGPDTGIVVLAADDSTGRHLHGVMTLGDDALGEDVGGP